MAELRARNPTRCRDHRRLAGARARARRGARRRGWSLVIDARRADRLDAAVGALASPRRTRRRHRRRRHRPRPPRGARPGRRDARAGAARRQQREHARRQPAPLDRAPSTRHVLRRRLRRQRDRADRAGAGARRDTRRPTPPIVNITSDAAVEAVRRLGRVRRVEGRARAREPRARGRATRPSRARSSIPATCAPRCTRTRFRARTSPTDPNPPSERARSVGSDHRRPAQRSLPGSRSWSTPEPRQP